MQKLSKKNRVGSANTYSITQYKTPKLNTVKT